MAETEKKLKSVWRTMIARCTNKNSTKYRSYGGRGLKVSKEWMDFNIFSRDMLQGYIVSEKPCSIDRVNNNRGYFKDNCRWATPKQQSNNRRSNRFISYLGKRKTVSQWADFFKIKYSTLKQRFYCYRWPIERCFEEKVRRRVK